MSPSGPYFPLGIQMLGLVLQWFLPKITVLSATARFTESTEEPELFFLKGGHVNYWLVSFSVPFLSLCFTLH